MTTLIFLGCAGWCLLSVSSAWRASGIDGFAWLGMAGALAHTAFTAL